MVGSEVEPGRKPRGWALCIRDGRQPCVTRAGMRATCARSASEPWSTLRVPVAVGRSPAGRRPDRSIGLVGW